MPIGLLHGYLLEGSGSNLWTRAIAQALCRQGVDLELVCQEPHPEDYDFIAELIRYPADGEPEFVYRRDTGYAGRCVMHRPLLGDLLPVYVPDRYEEFSRVVPMVELPDAAIEDYLERNTRVVERVTRERNVTALHANHAVLMSVVAGRVGQRLDVPFVVMPHGSAIEYAVKRDERFLRYATDAFRDAARVFVIGEEMRTRVSDVLAEHVPDLADKFVDLNLGVDTSLFRLAPREQRADEIDAMAASIADLPRGRTAAQQRLLRDHLASWSEDHDARDALDDFRAAIAPDVDYDLKSPDADIEERLSAIDWSRDSVVLFVGRLIANKGPQSLLAAAPEVLAQRPDARFLFVGHGPLREPLEAMAWALEHGDGRLLRRIVDWGTALEDGPVESFDAVASWLDALEREGRLDEYLEHARRHVSSRNVVFTGYLLHEQLRHLFAVADVAVFPSLIREAGPLVFLEAMAAGCYPMGTDFGGMSASIDAVEAVLGAAAVAPMRLSPGADALVGDIARQLPRGLLEAPAHRPALRELAVRRYDWTGVAKTFAETLEQLTT